jgi:serine/threonine protein kinase
MIDNSSSSALFAGRYRFQPVSSDWDRGRSGYTHLVFDIRKERLGVIKRAEIDSHRAVEALKNEVGALLDLKGPGVPEVYDTGEAEYGSKKYFYMVIEYVAWTRIEKNLDTLSAVDRAEILTQLFGILAKAHQMGIVNNDIDLKHLFWRKDEQQLVIIDWGNSRLHVDPQRETDFAFDLARSAEIIYTLITAEGRPPATGSLNLPNDSELFLGLTPAPSEFRNLCKWAPRTPVTNTLAPCTAQDLWEIASKWKQGVPYPYKSIKRPNWFLRLLVVAILVTLIVVGISSRLPVYTLFLSSTPTLNVSNTVTPATEVITITQTTVQTVHPIETTGSTEVIPSLPSPTHTPIAIVTPTPRSYSDANLILLLDKDYASSTCWKTTTDSSLGLQLNDGFTRREDRNWRFGTNQDHSTESSIQTDFRPCIPTQEISGVAVNMRVEQLKTEAASTNQSEELKSENEIGFFIEDKEGRRREYTIWIDNDGFLHLRILEDGTIVYDEIRTVVNNLSIAKSFPRSYAKFSIRMFLEMNNGKLDIIYLDGGSLIQSPGTTNDFALSDVTRVDSAVRPTMADIQTIGLIGHGGGTQSIIWPMAFYGK